MTLPLPAIRLSRFHFYRLTAILVLALLLVHFAISKKYCPADNPLIFNGKRCLPDCKNSLPLATIFPEISLSCQLACPDFAASTSTQTVSLPGLG